MCGTLRRKYLLFNWFHFLSILGRKYIWQGQICTGIISLWNVIFTFLMMHKNVPVISKSLPLIIKNQHSTDTRVVWLKNKQQNHCNLQLLMTKKGQRVHTSPPISFNVILRENESKCSSWWFSMPSINQCCEQGVWNQMGRAPFVSKRASPAIKSPASAGAMRLLIQLWPADSNVQSWFATLILSLDFCNHLIRAQLSPSLKTNVKHFEER